MMSASTYQYACPSCGRFADSLSNLLRHVRLMHFGAPGFTTMKCNLEGCHRTFRKYAVFRNHIYNYHSKKLEDTARVDTLNPVAFCSTPETSHVDPTLGSEDEPAEMDDLDSDFAEPISHKTPAISMQRAAAIWVLKTQEVRRLPQSTTEGIIQDVGALYDAALSNLHADVTEALTKAGVESATISEISSMFTPSGPHGNLFSGLETHYKQQQYFKKHLNYVVSALYDTCSVLDTCIITLCTCARFKTIDYACMASSYTQKLPDL